MTLDLLLPCAVKMLVTADVPCRRVVLWHWKISSSGRVAPPQLQNYALLLTELASKALIERCFL